MVTSAMWKIDSLRMRYVADTLQSVLNQYSLFNRRIKYVRDTIPSGSRLLNPFDKLMKPELERNIRSFGYFYKTIRSHYWLLCSQLSLRGALLRLVVTRATVRTASVPRRLCRPNVLSQISVLKNPTESSPRAVKGSIICRQLATDRMSILGK